MDLNEIEPKKSDAHVIGTDLSNHSVDELRALMSLLADEITRIEKDIAVKESQRNAADTFFKG